MTERNTTVIVVAVAAAWVFSMVVDGLQSAYEPPAAINAAFTVVIGFVLGVREKVKGED